MIHQFPTPLAIHTPLGAGEAILFIDYGLEVNSVWVIRLRGGIIKHFYSDDIRLYGNPMDGLGWDVDIPSAWRDAPTPPKPSKESGK